MCKHSRSSAGNVIADALSIPKLSMTEGGLYYKGSRKPVNGDVLVNYGIVGHKWQRFVNRLDRGQIVHVLNPWVGLNKYQWLIIAREAAIPIPQSYTTLAQIEGGVDNYIAKPYHSQGGNDIIPASEYRQDGTHYFQKLVQKRKYEIRISFFKWLDQTQWYVWKRIMRDEERRDQIAWNYHQGGSFIPIDNHNEGLFLRMKEEVVKLMNNSHLSFGAVDFIVFRREKQNHYYFIEVNTIPGFVDETNKDRYVHAFQELLNKGTEEQKSYGAMVQHR